MTFGKYHKMALRLFDKNMLGHAGRYACCGLLCGTGWRNWARHGDGCVYRLVYYAMKGEFHPGDLSMLPGYDAALTLFDGHFLKYLGEVPCISYHSESMYRCQCCQTVVGEGFLEWQHHDHTCVYRAVYRAKKTFLP